MARHRTQLYKPDKSGFTTDQMLSEDSAEIVSSPANPLPTPGQSAPQQATAANAPSATPQNITIINQQQGGGISPALLAASGTLKDKSPILAAILSLLIVGVGQFYNNQIGKGLLMIGMMMIGMMMRSAQVFQIPQAKRRVPLSSLYFGWL